MTTPTPSPASTRHRLLLVDDHPVVCQGLTRLLSVEPDLLVAGQAENATQATLLLEAENFDLAVVDVSLQGVSGIDLLKTIRARWPKLPVLMLSVHDEMLYAERALRAGANGYVMKKEKVECIITAIHQILTGRLYVSEPVNRLILNRVLSGNRSKNGTGTGQIIDLLSNRELEVFQFIGHGRGTRDIAQEMHVSVKTIETYRAHIKEKLHLKTAPELMRFALDWVNAQGVS